jgi:Na+/H+ antiporter NhaD/arsenite permease-like protein
MVLKEKILLLTGIKLDNASLTFASAFLMMLLFHQTPKQLFREIVDWEIIFFFIGLFIVVGSLEHTGVIEALGHLMIKVTGGNLVGLTLLLSTGSAIISTFIDNVPYNISMVSAILAIEKTGIWVYPLWWALNLGTSIGGAGSPIAAACNVIMFGQAEKDKVHINFAKYLLLSLPLVLLNSLIAFAVIYLRYLK